MNKYLIVVSLAFLTNILFGQQMKWSSVIENKDYNYIKIIGQNEEGFYVLKSNISFDDERDRVGFRSRRYSLAFFTNEMVLKWTHPLEAPLTDGKIVSVNMLNEKVIVIY